MSYRKTFDDTIRAVLAPCGAGAYEALWTESLAEEGVSYGRDHELEAEEAAAWYLSAAALVRMEEGALGVPLASRLLREARRVAQAQDLSPALQDALARMERERHEWIRANHEVQGAALRALRPVSAGLDFVEGLDLDLDEAAFDAFEDEFVPEPDWPDLLDRLLNDRSGAHS